MNITLSEEQRFLFNTALEFTEQALKPDQIESLEGQEPGFDPDIWQQMVALGWAGVVFPAAYGGTDLTLMELSLIVEACGRAALPSPLFSSVIEAGMLIDSAGLDPQRSTWLPRIADGEVLLTTAIFESSGGFEPTEIEMQATSTANGYRLSGTKIWVRDAAVAETLVVLARNREVTNGLTLFLVPASSLGVSYQRLSVAGDERLYDVTFADVDIGAEAVLGTPYEAWPAVQALLQRGACLKAAELLGLGQSALALTLEYAKTRAQFGSPLGSFQAVQHHCANMYRDLEACRLLIYQAATRLSEGMPAEREVAMAKAKASEAVPAITQLAHQVHGAVGYYRDYPLGLYHDRALAAQSTYGTARHHRRHLAKLLRQDPIRFRGRPQHDK